MDPELQELVQRMNQRYDEELEKIHHKIYKVRNRRYSCGKEARILANWLRVDELLTVRIGGPAFLSEHRYLLTNEDTPEWM